MVKNSLGDLGLILGLGRSTGEGNGNPLQYSRLGNLMARGAWHLKDNPWGHKELNMTEAIWHIHTLTLCLQPLQGQQLWLKNKSGPRLSSEAWMAIFPSMTHESWSLLTISIVPFHLQVNPTYSSRFPPHPALSTNQLAFPASVSLGPLCLTLIVTLDLTEPTHAIFTALYQVLCLPIKTQFLEKGIMFACLPRTPGLGTGHRALVTLS